MTAFFAGVLTALGLMVGSVLLFSAADTPIVDRFSPTESVRVMNNAADEDEAGDEGTAGRHDGER